jgi:hypothetical protein
MQKASLSGTPVNRHEVLNETIDSEAKLKSTFWMNVI